MITAKEKAWKLFNKYYSYLKANLMNDKEAWEDAKVCALIAVDEVLENSHTNVFTKYWEEVKKEIELL
jgi:hypothetical protein